MIIQFSGGKKPANDATAALRAEVAILKRALILCNESRNRLTCFAANPLMWVDEAVGEYGASTKEVSHDPTTA